MVAVAGFGFDDGDTIQITEESAEISALLFQSLEGDADRRPDWSNVIGSITAPTEQKRHDEAVRLAQTYNIDIVIYGTVSQDDYFNTAHPALAFSAAWVDQEPELFAEDASDRVYAFRRQEESRRTQSAHAGGQ